MPRVTIGAEVYCVAALDVVSVGIESVDGLEGGVVVIVGQRSYLQIAVS